jgi:hypothetical protein
VSLYEALLRVTRDDLAGAEEAILAVRQRLAPVMAALLKESYTRVRPRALAGLCRGCRRWAVVGGVVGVCLHVCRPL